MDWLDTIELNIWILFIRRSETSDPNRMTEAEAAMEEKLRKKKEEEEAMWAEYIEQRKKQRAKEEEELRKLKERQVQNSFKNYSDQ